LTAGVTVIALRASASLIALENTSVSEERGAQRPFGVSREQESCSTSSGP